MKGQTRPERAWAPSGWALPGHGVGGEKRRLESQAWEKCHAVFSLLGKILLHHSRHLPQPVDDESDCGVCGRKGAVQAPVLPEAPGTQAE